MNARHMMAVDLGRRRLRAVLTSRGKAGGTLKVRRVLVEDVPPDLNADDAEAFGHWAGESLRAAGFPKGKATIVIGREHVGVKRIVLPSVEAAELPDMTRLAMQRELPFDADSAVIDFIPVHQDEISTTVLAVAVPHTAVEQIKAVAKAAGLAVERITLRTMGVAKLISSQQSAGGEKETRRQGDKEARRNIISSLPSLGSSLPSLCADATSNAVLAIDILGEGVELCVIADDSIQFSRAAEVPQPQDQLAIADAVVTETRRTWMSYRVVDNAPALRAAWIIGDRRTSAYAAEPVQQMLKIPVHVVESHPLVHAANLEMDRVWPLAGVLLEQTAGGAMINFIRPRKAPDVSARHRQRWLAAAGITVVALLGAWTLARQQLQSLQRQATDLTSMEQEQRAANSRYVRDTVKLEHLKQWESVHIDWLEHASYLVTIAPPHNRLVLDSWMGRLNFQGVKYDRAKRKWSVDQQVSIEIDGEARDRETADTFRAALVQSSVYAIATPGADAKGGKRMPYAFTYRLRAKDSLPPDVAAQTTARSSNEPAH